MSPSAFDPGSCCCMPSGSECPAVSVWVAPAVSASKSGNPSQSESTSSPSDAARSTVAIPTCPGGRNSATAGTTISGSVISNVDSRPLREESIPALPIITRTYATPTSRFCRSLEQTSVCHNCSLSSKKRREKSIAQILRLVDAASTRLHCVDLQGTFAFCRLHNENCPEYDDSG